MLTLTLPSPNGTFCTMSLQSYKPLVKSRVPFAYRSYLWIRDAFPSRVFVNIYHNNGWTSVSGRGSTLDETENIRRHVPALIAKFEIKTILDIPCGNHAWMSRVNLGGCKYLGSDMVRDVGFKSAAVLQGFFVYESRRVSCPSELPRVSA